MFVLVLFLRGHSCAYNLLSGRGESSTTEWGLASVGYFLLKTTPFVAMPISLQGNVLFTIVIARFIALKSLGCKVIGNRIESQLLDEIGYELQNK